MPSFTTRVNIQPNKVNVQATGLDARASSVNALCSYGLFHKSTPPWCCHFIFERSSFYYTVMPVFAQVHTSSTTETEGQISVKNHHHSMLLDFMLFLVTQQMCHWFHSVLKSVANCCNLTMPALVPHACQMCQAQSRVREVFPLYQAYQAERPWSEVSEQHTFSKSNNLNHWSKMLLQHHVGSLSLSVIPVNVIQRSDIYTFQW